MMGKRMLPHLDIHIDLYWGNTRGLFNLVHHIDFWSKWSLRKGDWR